MQVACQVYLVVIKAVRDGGKIVLMTELSGGLQNCRKMTKICRMRETGFSLLGGGELAVGDNLAEGGFASDAGNRSAQPVKRTTTLI